MSKHYNAVISFNFKTEKDRSDWIKTCSGTGHAVLYTGDHEGVVYQKVITQKTVGDDINGKSKE